MLFDFFRRILAAASLATFALASPSAAETAKPALWEVSDPDTKIYLFGTIHLLPEGYEWKSRALDSAVSESDSLVVETIVDESNPQELIAALTSLGYSPGLPPLAERVSPDKRALLETAIARTKIPRPVFDRMETWVAAFTLLGVQFGDIGVKGQHGVEKVLRTSFAQSGKPVGQLETNVEQLGFFDTLPEHAQRLLLEGAVDTPETMNADFSAMLKSWATGDIEAIAKTFNEALAASPELREALISRRNANWTRWIEDRLDQPGTVLVAVGAGHLAGPDSVQQQLEAKGLKVRRLQ